MSKVLSWSLGIVCFAHVSIGFGANVFIAEDNTNVEKVVGVTGFQTHGDEMAGMAVTVFSNLVPAGETAIWNATGVGAGAAVGGTGWTLAESGDTFNNGGGPGLWNFSAPDHVVSRILIEGFASGGNVQEKGTIFDRAKPEFGTEGSFRGRDLTLSMMQGVWDIKATYLDPIQVDGQPLIGETYRALDLAFIPDPTGAGGFFRPNDFLAFYQDTDTVGLFRGCDGRDECTPEPTSAALLLLCGLVLPMTRKRQR